MGPIHRGEATVSCLGEGHGEPTLAMPLPQTWGRAPGQGVRGRSPPEAENLLASVCATEAANLPHSVGTLILSK